MAIRRTQAQKLCNAAEMELFGLSLGDALKALSVVQLRGKVKRARTLRDKFADQFRRQTAATQSDTGTKRGNSGQANARTEQKLQLFDEVLKRFETRAEQLDAQAARAAAAAARASGKAAAQAAAIARRKAAPKAEPAAPKKSAARRAAAQSVAAPAAAAPAPTPAPRKKAARTAAPEPEQVAATPPVRQGPTAAARSSKAPKLTRATAVSPVVTVRGKNIGAHARSSQARSQAKRDKRS